MSVCPTVLVLRFYGCCHPCFLINLNNIVKGFFLQIPNPCVVSNIYARVGSIKETTKQSFNCRIQFVNQ